MGFELFKVSLAGVFKFNNRAGGQTDKRCKWIYKDSRAQSIVLPIYGRATQSIRLWQFVTPKKVINSSILSRKRIKPLSCHLSFVQSPVFVLFSWSRHERLKREKPNHLTRCFLLLWCLALIYLKKPTGNIPFIRFDFSCKCQNISSVFGSKVIFSWSSEPSLVVFTFI